MKTKLKLALAAALVVALAVEASETFTGPLNLALLGVVAPAQAKVGRPLTPVSVAGVSRRTRRRCASGVYNC